MADVARRVERLRERVKRKLEEVYHFLDDSFYNRCRAVLKAVMELDGEGVFSGNPAKLPNYLVCISEPMWWGCIEERLTHYKYHDVAEFIYDMRLVVNNCYTYNGEESPFTALGRRLEIAMEDLFVTELSVSPPDWRKLVNLGKGISREHARAVMNIICRYEKHEQGGTSKVQISTSKLKCATQRRVYAYLQQNTKTNERDARPDKPSCTQKQPQQRPTAKSPSRPPVKNPQPARSLLEVDTDVRFEGEQGVVGRDPSANEQRLEPVPQNKRCEFPSLGLVSPVSFDGTSDDEFEEGDTKPANGN
ncbi:putative DNA-binding protein [Trypanosoma vivax]|nr:putative DNA-binding protein [Trypanosoma vivax]